MNTALTYEHRDDSPEVAETKVAAFRYIIEGDSLDTIYEPQGLLVFAVIAALRENDEQLYGDDAHLTPEQLLRLAEVEAEVDAAVENAMHYYPFGDHQNKRLLGIAALHSLEGTHQTPAYANPNGINKISHKSVTRRIRAEAYEAGRGKPEDRNGPVITKE